MNHDQDLFEINLTRRRWYRPRRRRIELVLSFDDPATGTSPAAPAPPPPPPPPPPPSAPPGNDTPPPALVVSVLEVLMPALITAALTALAGTRLHAPVALPVLVALTAVGAGLAGWICWRLRRPFLVLIVAAIVSALTVATMWAWPFAIPLLVVSGLTHLGLLDRVTSP